MFDATPDYGRAIQWQAEQIEQERLERGEHAAQVYAEMRDLFYSAAMRLPPLPPEEKAEYERGPSPWPAVLLITATLVVWALVTCTAN